MRYPEFDADFWKDNDCYGIAYEIVEYAMTLVAEEDLASLKTALHFASEFVNNELEEMPDKAKELGLHKWVKAQALEDKLEEDRFLDGRP